MAIQFNGIKGRASARVLVKKMNEKPWQDSHMSSSTFKVFKKKDLH